MFNRFGIKVQVAPLSGASSFRRCSKDKLPETSDDSEDPLISADLDASQGPSPSISKVPLDNPLKQPKPPISGWKHLLSHKGDSIPPYIYVRRKGRHRDDELEEANRIRLGKKSITEIRETVMAATRIQAKRKKERKKEIKKKENEFKILMEERRKLRREREEVKTKVDKALSLPVEKTRNLNKLTQQLELHPVKRNKVENKNGVPGKRNKVENENYVPVKTKKGAVCFDLSKISKEKLASFTSAFK